MRFFDLLNFQHVVLYVLPTLIFIVLFIFLLAYSHFRTEDAEKRMEEIQHRFADGIGERHAPFPLGLALIIAGTAVWGFFYILVTGLLGVKI
jgi:hypothetical protein